MVAMDKRIKAAIERKTIALQLSGHSGVSREMF